jgi:hypothetical protein
MKKYVVNGNISVCKGADADVWRGNIDGDSDAGVKFLGEGAERPMSLMTLVSSLPHPQLLPPPLTAPRLPHVPHTSFRACAASFLLVCARRSP